MKPNLCVLCQPHHTPEQHQGEWVMFADYQAQEGHSKNPPPGYEFFCNTHAPYAKCFSSLPSKQAINLLKQNLSLYSLDLHPPKANKWLRFFSKLYQR